MASGLRDPHAARQELSAVVTELGPPLAEQAHAHARTVSSFLELNWFQRAVRRSKVKDPVRDLAVDSRTWPEAVMGILASYDIPNCDELRAIFSPLGARFYPRFDAPPSPLPLDAPTGLPSLEDMLGLFHAQLTEAADNLASLRRPALLPARHPPAFARLRDDVVAESVADGLTELVDEGLRQYEAARAGHCPRDSRRVGEESERALSRAFLTSEVFGGLIEVNRGLRNAEVNAWGNGLLSKVYEKAAAGIHPRIHASCLTITVNYLAEVLELMPDYAEASGQGKRRDPVTVIGNVGQINIADTITSIGATIKIVESGGQTSVADAIRALTQAVQQAPELAEEQRAQLLDHVADVADAAAAPGEPRKLSRAKAAMAIITKAAGASTQLAQTIETWHGVFGKLS
jgi:hypothetical protein